MDTLQKAGLLQLLPNMPKIEAMACAIAFLKAYDVRIDWHEFAYYLDELRTNGIIRIKPGYGSGLVEYELNS